MSAQQPPQVLQTTTETLKDWHKVNPLAVIYYFIAFVKGLANNIILLIPVIYATYDKITAQPMKSALISLALIAGLVIFATLKFMFYRYRLTIDHVQIRTGIFSKAFLDLPFSRIQNVTFEQPLYYRPFNIVCLELDTAGSIKQEAKILAVDLALAEQIKANVLTVNQEVDTNAASANDSDIPHHEERILNTRSIKDLVIHGLVNNRIWLLIAPLLPLIDDIGKYISDYLNKVGIDIESLLTIGDRPMWQITFMALTLTLAIMVLLSLISILISIISFYGFKLTKLGDRYIRRCGLFTRQETSMKLSRLQMISQKQDWLDRLLKRANLTFVQAGQNHLQTHNTSVNDKIVVPSITLAQSQTLMDDALQDNQLQTIQYTNISKRYLLTYIGLVATSLTILLLTFALTINETPLIPIILGSYGLYSLTLYLRWRRWGYAVDDNFLYIRKGILGVDYFCLPLFKVQQTSLKQSVWMKKYQLCSIEIILASGAQTIPYIKQANGAAIIDDSLRQCESSAKSWM